MHLFSLNIKSEENFQSFIDSWAKLYTFSNESFYKRSISKQYYTEIDIQNLFVWKNGMRLSRLKQKSLDQKIKSKLDFINQLKGLNFDIEVFRDEFSNLSTVWKIFLLHIIKPNKYPIYDQHIHRAFLYINKEKWNEVSNTSLNNKQKEEFYFNRYLPFIISQKIKDIKKLDEALFAFGQFLNTHNYLTLSN